MVARAPPVRADRRPGIKSLVLNGAAIILLLAPKAAWCDETGWLLYATATHANSSDTKDKDNGLSNVSQAILSLNVAWYTTFDPVSPCIGDARYEIKSFDGNSIESGVAQYRLSEISDDSGYRSVCRAGTVINNLRVGTWRIWVESGIGLTVPCVRDLHSGMNTVLVSNKSTAC